jgi:hypothetical protein
MIIFDRIHGLIFTILESLLKIKLNGNVSELQLNPHQAKVHMKSNIIFLVHILLQYPLDQQKSQAEPFQVFSSENFPPGMSVKIINVSLIPTLLISFIPIRKKRTDFMGFELHVSFYYFCIVIILIKEFIKRGQLVNFYLQVV